MDEVIKRSVLKSFPELSAGSHLPRHCKVVSVRETPDDGKVSDKFRPYYAVDVQVLDDHGRPDKNYPVLKDVPLPVQSAGHESGVFSFPEDGTHVTVQFANGSPNSPFISNIMPTDKALPKVERGEYRVQQSKESFTRIDKDGSHERITNQSITDHSTDRVIESMTNTERYAKSILEIDADNTVTIGGSKTQKIMQNYQTLVGGRLELGALGAVAITSKVNQTYKAPKTWIGSDSENVLQLLSELKAQVKSLCDTLESHTHGGVMSGISITAPPTQAVAVTNVGTEVNAIKARLDSIKL